MGKKCQKVPKRGKIWFFEAPCSRARRSWAKRSPLLKKYFEMQIVLLKSLAMDIAMMKLTLLTATMMEVTVVDLVSTQKNVQNVYVMKEASQWLTFHVSDLLMI